jgi:NADPH-dependent ferric siderophore reductase
MVRVVAGGEALAGFALEEPAASVRLLIPSENGSIVIPAWTGNQWELPSGGRPPIRTFTPRSFDSEQRELTLDVVLHDRGAASDWARSAVAGNQLAISGPAAGYRIEPGTGSYVLAGDESALPAIGQLLEWIPPHARIDVHVEIGDDAARQQLPAHPQADVRWHLARPDSSPGAAFAAAIESLADVPETSWPEAWWVAGEAAAVQRVRRHLFETRELPRSVVTARGYWKFGRSAT